MNRILPTSRLPHAALLGLAIGLLAPAAQAAEQGWFGGISASPFLTRGDSGFSLGPVDLGARLRGAYPVTRTLGVEVGYADGAKSGNDLASPNGASDLARGWLLSGTGTVTLGDRLGLVGRLGAYRGDIDLNPINRSLGDPSVPHATYGMGVKYDFTSNLRLQGGWDRYHLGNGPRLGTDAGVDLVSIGLKYRF